MAVTRKWAKVPELQDGETVQDVIGPTSVPFTANDDGSVPGRRYRSRRLIALPNGKLVTPDYLHKLIREAKEQGGE